MRARSLYGVGRPSRGEAGTNRLRKPPWWEAQQRRAASWRSRPASGTGQARRAGAWLAALLLIAAPPAAALGSLELEVGAIEGGGWSGGTARAELRLGADGGAVLEARGEGLAFSDARGLRAGEGVGGALRATLRPGGRVSGEVRLDAGQVYLDPLFHDAGLEPLELSFTGRLDAPSGRLEVERLTVRLGEVARLEGALVLTGAGLERARVELAPRALGPLFEAYLRPYLAGTALAGARARGRAGARLELAGGRLRGWDLTLEAVGLDDGAGRLELEGLSGELHWRSEGPVPPTRLRLSAARLYRIDLGAVALEGELRGERFRLRAPLVVPLLGGALRVERLDGEGLGGEAPAWTLSGRLEPLSLERLSAALGWPALAGTIGGSVPALRIARDELRVEGDLQVEVFDGEVVVSRLRLESPFGVVPRLSADARLRNLSLEALTRTFSFGRILGRLEGRIDGLVLEDWRPSAFDALLRTPEDDTSEHRISQRAVDNLASLGGAGGALSSSFLRLFETFSYRRLGLRCRLARGVCEMGGVAPAPGGYYIVEGGGLPPRIDVIGFNRRVDWATLVARLRAIGSSGAPVVR